MPLLLVQPDNTDLVAASVDLVNAARAVDDPSSPRAITELTARELQYGWDLEPDERYLYLRTGATEPVGVLDVAVPKRDNRHLVWAEVTVHPEHRRRGHGSAMVAEVVRRTQEEGRDTIWLGTAEDDDDSRAFLEHRGFRYASHDARRRQVLAEVDWAAVDQLEASAQEAAAAYAVERLTPPLTDDVLAELVEVTAAINDAPMGELTWERDHVDVQRLKDMQTARAGVGSHLYQVVARHRDTGEVGGHTVVVTHPLEAGWGHQGDTAVSRAHRGRRLGLLVKIEMMRWLAEVEPQLKVVETWNQADNTFMINVNEAIGYRLSRIYNMYEMSLREPAPAADRQLAATSA
jgi:GNAT superfamily N-acetyltransferase